MAAQEAPERFVAYFDILGYREWLKEASATAILERMEGIWGGFAVPTDHWGRGQAQVVHYADTTVAFTEGVRHLDLDKLLVASSWFVHELIASGKGVRCSIVRGSFEARIEPFVGVAGMALLDAHDLEKDQDWVGGVIDGRCLGDDRDGCTGDCKNLARPYMVPFKKRQAVEAFALDWTVWELPAHSERRVAVDAVHEIYAQPNRWPWDVYRKWKASSDFLDARRADPTRTRPDHTMNRLRDRPVLYPGSREDPKNPS